MFLAFLANELDAALALPTAAADDTAGYDHDASPAFYDRAPEPTADLPSWVGTSSSDEWS